MEAKKVPTPKSISAPETRGNHGARRPRKKVRKSVWVPSQHGAWAMILAPLTLGAVLSGFTWKHAFLTLAAAAAYAAFEVGTDWFKSHWKPRYRTAFLTYSCLAALAALPLLLTTPALLSYLLLSPIAAFELWMIYQRRERDLSARLAVVFLSMALAPIAYQLGRVSAFPWRAGDFWVRTFVLALYLVGTVPHVKVLIRQRRSNAWFAGSVAYHGLAALVTLLLACGGAGWLLGDLFVPKSAGSPLPWAVVAVMGVALLRSIAFPAYSRWRGHPLKPVLIGMTEVVLTVALLLALLR